LKPDPCNAELSQTKIKDLLRNGFWSVLMAECSQSRSIKRGDLAGRAGNWVYKRRQKGYNTAKEANIRDPFRRQMRFEG
jgi:hypothetical protein